MRLGDTSLILEVEKDFTVYGDELQFGGGKVTVVSLYYESLEVPITYDTYVCIENYQLPIISTVFLHDIA